MDSKVDSHIKDAGKKNEELKKEIQKSLQLHHKEHGETINTLKQKIVEVDGRQRSTEETDRERESRDWKN